MSDSDVVVMYGRDNEAPYEIRCQTLKYPKIGFGMSEGTTSKPNEDCLGISVLENGVWLSIADGHWGRGASELAIQKATEIFRSLDAPSTEEEIQERFYNLFEQIESELFEKAKKTPGALAPETTLIVCHLKEILSEQYLYWSSFGDSFLFVFRGGELIQLNSLHANWLGMLSRFSVNGQAPELGLNGLFGELGYIGVAEGLETGIEKLQPGDMIFLCTDGLIGSDEEVPESVSQQIRAILHDPVSLEHKIRQLIQFALDRGEKDNVSCIVAEMD